MVRKIREKRISPASGPATQREAHSLLASIAMIMFVALLAPLTC